MKRRRWKAQTERLFERSEGGSAFANDFLNQWLGLYAIRRHLAGFEAVSGVQRVF